MNRVIDIRERSLNALTKVLESGNVDSFSFIIRHNQKTNDVIEKLKDCLAGHFIGCETVKEWPGTILHDLAGNAIIYKYRFNEDSARTLSLLEDDLDNWIEPFLPEDLVFYRNGDPILVSITHERDCYFEVDSKFEHILNYYGIK